MMECSFISAEGLLRPNNEDNLRYKTIGDYTVILVADGMGGHRGGEVASKIAVDFIMNAIENDPEMLAEQRFSSEATDLFRRANVEILMASIDNPDLSGMGTTVTLAVIKDRTVQVVHIGDSRCYLLHRSSITRLTKDHSYAQMLFDQQKITSEELENHPGRSQLTKILGENEYIQPDYYRYNVMYGDLILLTTDGIHSVLNDSEIVSCLSKHNDLDGGLQKLRKAVYDKGAPDNLTAVLAIYKP